MTPEPVRNPFGRTPQEESGRKAPLRPALLTVRECADQLGCSAGNVYALIESGKLPVVCVGRQKGYRIDSRDLEVFIEERKFRYQPAPVDTRQRPLKHLKL